MKLSVPANVLADSDHLWYLNSYQYLTTILGLTQTEYRADFYYKKGDQKLLVLIEWSTTFSMLGS